MDLQNVLTLIEQYRYLIIFPLACIEGPLLAFVTGSLVALGYFDPFILLLVLVLGDIVPDGIYYLLGRYGKKKSLVERVGPKLGITPERFELVRELWFNHTFKTMAITKYAYGLSIPLLISSGLVNLPFRRFWMSSIPLSFLQYGLLMALGYFFGSSFLLVQDTLLRVQMGIAALAVVGLGYYFITRSVKKTFWKPSELKEDADKTL